MRKPRYQRWYARLLWKLRRWTTMEGMASEQAHLQHNILQYLDNHVDSQPIHAPGQALFMDRHTIAEALGTTPQIVFDQMFVLTQAELVHPETFNTEEVYTLTRPGKAALVERTLLTRSARERVDFINSRNAMVISVAAFIIALLTAIFK